MSDVTDWEDKLREVVDASSCAEVGRRIGYSRVAVSHIYHDRYAANTDRIRDAFLAAYVDGVSCPHLGRSITPAECADHRSGPMPTSDRERFQHWTACRACPLNPNKRTSNADR